ncbi:kinesin-like protein Klp8, partial [Ascosphaera aggregata]
MEARAERVEQRLVRQNVGNKDLTGGSVSSGTGIGSPLAKSVMTARYTPGGHERTDSLDLTMTMAFDLDPTVSGCSPRVGSPTSIKNLVTKELDWRKEAAGAASGPAAAPEKIKELSDTELDALFDDVQKARAHRRSKMGSMTLPSSSSDYGGKGNPAQNRAATPADGEEDSDIQSQSSSAFQVREKYLSNGTIDNMSLDTAITMPSTPGRKGVAWNSLECESSDRNEEANGREVDDTTRTRQDMRELLAEKTRMAEELEATQKELRRQRETFEEQMKDLPPEQVLSLIYKPLDEKEIITAKTIISHWKARNYVHMAETVLKQA